MKLQIENVGEDGMEREVEGAGGIEIADCKRME